MSDTTNVLAKLAAVADVFNAAKTLEQYGLLQGRDAASVVREYVAANPEINAALKQGQQP